MNRKKLIRRTELAKKIHARYAHLHRRYQFRNLAPTGWAITAIDVLTAKEITEFATSRDDARTLARTMKDTGEFLMIKVEDRRQKESAA